MKSLQTLELGFCQLDLVQLDFVPLAFVMDSVYYVHTRLLSIVTFNIDEVIVGGPEAPGQCPAGRHGSQAPA